MSKLTQIILRGTRAAQPLATVTPPGSLYYVTDEAVTERVADDGLTWEDYTDAGGGGSGTVTNTGTLTADTVIVGNGGVDIKALALGSALQVLRVNAGATAVEFAAGGSGTVTTTGTPSAGQVAVFSSATVIGGSAVTGAGDVVAQNSPTLITPALGTPSALVLTNATGLPLTTGVTGTLPIANGGTANTTATAAFDALAPTTTAGDLIFHNGTDNVRLGIGTAGQVLKTNAGATAPEWGAAAGGGDVSGPGASTDNAIPTWDGTGGDTLADSSVLIDASNHVTGMASLTLTNTGLHLLDTNASHDLIIAPGSDLAADRTLTLTTGDANRTLTITADSSIGGTAYVAGGTDVAIADGGTGQSTATAAFDALAPTTTAGDLIYHNGTDNIRLGIGTALQVLRTNAGATAPEWAAASGGGLTYTAGGADADQAMAVNTFYYVDISGYSADRTYTLPATAAVGDICAIGLTSGDTAFELLITANTGDTLNGVAGGTEWSRLFITGETVYMLCTQANAAWIVTDDGRIKQSAAMFLSTLCDGETASAVTLPTSAATPGAWTSVRDNASLITLGTGRITTRRAGSFWAHAHIRTKDNLADTQFATVNILKDGASTMQTVIRSPAASTIEAEVSGVMDMTVDQFGQLAYSTQAGGLGLANSSLGTLFEMVEIL